VTGGQTVFNPWNIIGGVASSVVATKDFIMCVQFSALFSIVTLICRPDGARVGDVIVLTKPLGTQVSVNAHQWLAQNTHQSVAHVIDPDAILKAYQ
jgi:selenide,water dikinase